jgi:hypothetical protein
MFPLNMPKFFGRKYITWPKKSEKGKQEWMRACIIAGFKPRKLNTSIKTK